MKRFCVVLTAALLLLVPLVGPTAGPPAFTPVAPGVGDPYFPLDGNGGYDVTSYDLAVRYDPASDQLSGIATISARATQNLSRFNLDLDGLRVRSIEVDGVMGLVELEAGPFRLTAAITRDAVEELALAEGARATATVKATSVMIERSAG